MELTEADSGLLAQAPEEWAPLSAIVARYVDHVQHLGDMGLVRTRMMPLESRPGHARMEWQITRKGRRALASSSKA